MPKTRTVTISSDLLAELITLCRDLDTLNPRNTNRDGSVSVGPGRLANWQDITRRLLPELEEAKNAN